MSKSLSLKPSDAQGCILRDLILSGEKPPHLSSADMHLLDFNNTGIAAVREALSMKPFQYLAYRELSRYVSKVALDRMNICPVIDELKGAKKEYYSHKPFLEQRIRKYYDDRLSGVSRGYKPFVVDKNVRIWFWDNTVKEAVDSSLSESGIARQSFFVFAADVLSELTELGTVAEDLKAEYKQGLRYFKFLLAATQLSDEK